ncbi:MmcQ/YjbR family DNA-binding protein [Geodermatophilus marinus]|uniref:MmcQ/YjbR family DNA-binding protein n=1 Tax=Geodermatophilus sp. LHW52908 TaxID=2303986 RepID=UPI000E3D002D|nr:MmcQ/YjbR family DNA-binding protein [Geodermatophilus sp. LHW52908]RFU23021.1 MmcQ/YjbR family DNA-binding protein [Geodermatophilus sp. LHW52908]
MADWSDVRALALALPETAERTSRGSLQWVVRARGFVWERPLRRADLAHLGDRAPAGPLLGAYVPDLGVKEALLADDPAVYLTTPHFDGYPVVLARLEVIGPEELAELVTEAWLCRAPTRLARAHLATHPPEDLSP